jgi:hypothetical protein
MNIETFLTKESSFISKASWFEEGNILMLTFSTGSIWAYFDVPFEIFSGFCRAKSYGSYFNNNIRNIYIAQRVNYAARINGEP